MPPRQAPGRAAQRGDNRPSALVSEGAAGGRRALDVLAASSGLTREENTEPDGLRAPAKADVGGPVAPGVGTAQAPPLSCASTLT